jgi:eukaryotic-like serine/threonine-protein kinase
MENGQSLALSGDRQQMSNVTPDRWQQLKELFDTAIELEPQRRSAFLDEACAGDADLRNKLEALVASHEEAESFIEAPAYEVAAHLIANNQRELIEGQRVGPYRVVAAIGAGGMGEVYLAQDTRLGRRVALKLLPSDFTRDEGRLQRFEQEARAASILNHPNIITIHEIGRADGINFIATEFIDGQTLRQQINRGEMTLNDALDVSIQAAGALAAAHAAGITHRDIKPENIMLRPDGYVKVLDFGLAKLSEQHTDSGALTLAGVSTDPGLVMGTVGYMSPEQARGLSVDSRTDIFSLGVVIYEMIGGRAPFEGSSAGDIIASILHMEPPPLARYTRDSSEALEWIVAKALRKDREERYQTVTELLADLKSLREERAFAAKRDRTASGEPPSPAVVKTAERPAAYSAGLMESLLSEHTPLRTTSSAEYIVSEIKRHKKGAVMALAIIIGTAAAIAYFSAGRSAAAIESIAVMPFINTGSDANAEYLSDGITENIINSLSRLSALQVMARATVFRYKGQEVDPQKVGRDLKVAAVVMGRVTQRGDALSIQVELVDVSTGRQVWGEQYNRKLSDVLSLQESISREISQRLRSTLNVADQQRLAKRYTDNPEAYQLYLKGRYHWNKRSQEGIRKALEYFEQAVQLDPNYSLAYAGLADSYSMLGIDLLSKAKAAANRALEMDEQLAEAHTSLGYLKMRGEWDWPGAEKELQRAIELNPSYATAHQWYSIYLELTDHPEEAVREARRAQELDPLSTIINQSLADRLYFAREYVRAIEQARSTLEIDPNSAGPHVLLGKVYLQQRKHKDAVEELQKAVHLHNNPFIAGVLAHAYALSGNKNEAEKIVASLKEQPKRAGVLDGIATVYAGLGEKEEALAWLDKAYEARSDFIVFIKVDPAWDGLRSDPRFQDLLRRIGLASVR